MTTTTIKLQALALFLGVAPNEIAPTRSEDRFEVGHDEYLVLTDDEADEACEQEIEQSLWAFNPEFLSAQTGIDETVFRALSGLSEDANEAVLALIEHTVGIAKFVADVVATYGRGEFLAQYDSNEKRSGDVFIYRGRLAP